MKDGEFKELSKPAVTDEEKAIHKARVEDILHNVHTSGKTYDTHRPAMAALDTDFSQWNDAARQQFAAKAGLDTDFSNGNDAARQQFTAKTPDKPDEKTEDKGEDKDYSYGLSQ